MVPLFSSQRRHRLNPLEVPEVIESLKLRLQHHLRDRENLLAASIAFRTYYRLIIHSPGRPNYPEPITWKLIEDFLGLKVMVPLPEVPA